MDIKTLQRDAADYAYSVASMDLLIREFHARDFPTVDELHDDDSEVIRRQLGFGLIPSDYEAF